MLGEKEGVYYGIMGGCRGRSMARWSFEVYIQSGLNALTVFQHWLWRLNR